MKIVIICLIIVSLLFSVFLYTYNKMLKIAFEMTKGDNEINDTQRR